MRIGVLGGSFNPPHKYHLEIAVSLIKEDIVHKVIFVPNIINPYHKKGLISPNHRYNMVKLLIENYPNLEVSDIDILKDKQNYTYETLDQLQSLYPKDELFLIIGSDNLKEIGHWGNYEYLIHTYKIIVTKRNKDDIKSIISNINILNENINNIIPFEEFKTSSLSSTFIRNELSQDQDVSKYVSKKVYDYIKENNLYKEGV